jgi:hypothetical protein
MFDYPTPGENSFINFQEFNASGTFYRPRGQKWTRAWIMCIGGGNAYTLAKGGPGACMMREVYLSSDSYTTTIGAGGTPSVPAGGATSFGGTIVYASGGNANGNMGTITQYYTDYNSKNINSFAYTSYGSNTQNTRIASRWTYKRQTQVTFTNSGSPYGYNGNSGANSGAGGETAGTSGGSGYCIIFYEDTLKTGKFASGTYQHLKKQTFSSSGTFYRPTRFPATLAFVCVKRTLGTNAYYACGTYFLTSPSYTMTIGTDGTGSFGNILDTTTDYGDQYSSVECHTCTNVASSTGKIAHFASESLAQADAWVMYFE